MMRDASRAVRISLIAD